MSTNSNYISNFDFGKFQNAGRRKLRTKFERVEVKAIRMDFSR